MGVLSSKVFFSLVPFLSSNGMCITVDFSLCRCVVEEHTTTAAVEGSSGLSLSPLPPFVCYVVGRGGPLLLCLMPSLSALYSKQRDDGGNKQVVTKPECWQRKTTTDWCLFPRTRFLLMGTLPCIGYIIVLRCRLLLLFYYYIIIVFYIIMYIATHHLPCYCHARVIFVSLQVMFFSFII